MFALKPLIRREAAYGAAWQRAFLERHGPDLGALVRVYREYSHVGAPVHTWDV